MASSRHLNLPEQGHFGRRRHVPQISISDGTHHVTEAIGDLYGDDDTSKRDSQSSTYTSSPPPEENRERRSTYFDSHAPYTPTDTSPLSPHSNERYPNQPNGSPIEGRRRKSSLHSSHSHSPPLLTRSNSSESATQHFPLNDIDSQSSPAAVAQELSNLQAIRRMSMNVDAADPDLPAFGPTFSVPTAPPSSTDDEDDAARMFWVPARIHPELAPSEFKTFVEDRVERIRRRSDEGNDLGADGVGRTGSNSSINRRKSMLSRTIDSGIGYQDGADVLERKRSRSSQTSLDFPETLQELEPKLKDPVELVRKMSVDSSRRSLDTDSDPNDDAPILPSAPGGQSLRRSTRTNYRRGSLRKGERVIGSLRRGLQRTSDGDAEQIAPNLTASTPTPPIQTGNEDQNYDLTRVRTAPDQPLAGQPDNFSRPSRKGRPQLQPSASLGDVRTIDSYDQPPESGLPESRNPLSFRSRIASNGRTTAHLPTQSAPQAVPQITETPPAPQPDQRHSAPPQPSHPVISLPERKSSHDYARQNQTQHAPMEGSQLRPDFSNNRRPNQTIHDMANSPSMMLGMSTRTDALTFIPSFADDREERKPEKKSKSSKDHDGVSKKPSWGWLSRQDSEKEKDRKEKEKEEKESRKSKKSKPVISAPHDSTRLDLLSAASDGTRGRESLVLDRDSIKLADERLKDSPVRKPVASDAKSSGASGIFSSLFGGKKKTNERDAKKADANRRLSPDPPRRNLRADIDYNWTRFSILEERAIYRMAHLKLANPRRALYSQVLLSNFMYSYLAKVQQMHPQIQIPAFVQKQQNGNSQKNEPSKEQSSQNDEYSAWQRYQEQHDDGSTPATNTEGSGSNFIEDYDPGHQEQEDNRRQHEHQQQQQYRGKNQQYVNGNSNGNGNGNGNGNAGPYPQQPLAYNQKSRQQQEQQNQRDLYTAQGLFDRDKTPEHDDDDDDLW